MPKRTPFLEVALWFAQNQRAMPWRDDPSPYKVWISEIMLQQTTVSAVVPYFQRFLHAFPNIKALAAADEQRVLALWAGLGYYNRARNLLAAARAIGSDDHFPSAYESLLALKGVGPYTAGAVASIAFHQTVPLIDTNVERVLGRFCALKREKGFDKRLRIEAERLVKEAYNTGVDPAVWNQSLMEIGALVCFPKAPRCSQCPLSEGCIAYLRGESAQYPGEKPPPTLRNIEESVLLGPGKGCVFLVQYKGKRRKGLWDLPLGLKGKEIGFLNYRISNDRVHRRIFFSGENLPMQEGELFFLGKSLPPLCSPARKILQKYENILSKEGKTLDKALRLL